jgi:integrase
MRRRPTSAPAPDLAAHLRPLPVRCELSVEDVARRYLEREEAKGRRSIIDARSSVQRHIIGILGRMRADEVTPRHAEAFVRSLTAAGYAGATVVRLKSYLSRVLDLAVELGAAPRNPCRDLPRGTLPSREPREPERGLLEVLSLDEIHRLLSTCPVSRLLVWAVYLLTGVRFGEGAALRWSDLHEATPLAELTVQRSWSSRLRSIGPTKTGYSRRIPVHPQLQRWLDQARVRRQPEPDALILAGRGEEPRLEQWTLKAWHGDLRRAGIADPSTGPRRLHSARHTFASQLVRAGVAESLVESLTHRRSRGRSESCVAIYAHESWERKCSAIMALRVEVDREAE